jgi:hypothetical protein
MGDPVELFAHESPATQAFVKAHDDLALQARVYLRPCPGGIDPLACQIDQHTFIMDYIGAFYGDHNAQTQIAYILSGDGLPPYAIKDEEANIGVGVDPVMGCAWRIAILLSANPQVELTDLDQYDTDCHRLAADKLSEATTLGGAALLKQMHQLAPLSKADLDLIDSY